MRSKEEFPFNNWYLKFTEEERPIVDNWRINIIKHSSKPCPRNYINYAGIELVWGGGAGLVISIEEFKKYVLNIDEFPINEEEDYSYLIPILNKLNKLNK